MRLVESSCARLITPWGRRREAAQTQLCAYLSIALLLRLGANALAGWWWADSLAALIIAAVALKEGRESWQVDGPPEAELSSAACQIREPDSYSAQDE
jgi:hypothetical protein